MKVFIPCSNMVVGPCTTCHNVVRLYDANQRLCYDCRGRAWDLARRTCEVCHHVQDEEIYVRTCRLCRESLHEYHHLCRNCLIPHLKAAHPRQRSHREEEVPLGEQNAESNITQPQPVGVVRRKRCRHRKSHGYKDAAKKDADIESVASQVTDWSEETVEH